MNIQEYLHQIGYQAYINSLGGIVIREIASKKDAVEVSSLELAACKIPEELIELINEKLKI